MNKTQTQQNIYKYRHNITKTKLTKLYKYKYASLKQQVYIHHKTKNQNSKSCIHCILLSWLNNYARVQH